MVITARSFMSDTYLRPTPSLANNRVHYKLKEQEGRCKSSRGWGKKMSSFDIKLVILSLNLLFITLSEAKAHVTIISNVEKGTLKIHCYSKDNDLGIHYLAYDQSFDINFVPNFWGNTKFYCDFTTQFGSGNYAVYDRLMESKRCGLKCVWYINENGPCLVLNPSLNLWCQPWRNASKRLQKTHKN
ncbi:unnamed protein product [Fraxinus pennsylvanica]|uniref:S-protein homolog n=1 Tax=Fraxinus pennsylvanica TaxID=56036 RepID=A0AAD1ZW14_9LAMI|nr:unnamed protein product [Fraxinus pennsylvanica]